MSQEIRSRSVDEFFSKPAESFQRLCDSGRAESLTLDGQTRAIVMSPETYRALVERDDLYFAEVTHTEADIESMRASLCDIEAGRVLPIEAAPEDVRRRLLDRIAARGTAAAT